MTDAIEPLRSALGSRYEILEELGSGGMATVYLAYDRRHARNVAVKVLHEDLTETVGADRFVEEIRIAANLSHPHILPVHDSGRAGGRLHYVMPYAEGESLAERLKHDGRMPVPEVVSVIRDVVDALAYAHSRGVVHRDIKPGNVMLQGRHALITDFGVAKALSEATLGDPGLTEVGIAVGTPAYMAPEQAAAQEDVDERADLYGVGILAYELLTGLPPFSGNEPRMILTAQITRDPAPILEARPDLPPALADFVMRCLEKDPAERWQSAAEMLDHLDAIAAEVNPIVTAAAALGRLRPRAWPVRAGVAGLFALVIGGAAGWAAFSPPEVAPTARAVIAVFENHTGDVALDPMGHMLQDWLTDGLLQSGLLEVVPTITARGASAYVGEGVASGRFRDPIGALSAETGADIVVSGSIYRYGDELRIRTSVTDVSGEEPKQLAPVEPVVGPADDVTGLLDEVRQRLLGVVAASTDQRLRDQLGEGGGAPRFEAYRLFDRGLDLYATREYEEASELFLEAFERDPSYPVPLLYASLSLRNHNEWQRSDSVVTILESRRAEFAEYQRHWIDYSRAILDGDLDRARITVRRAARAAPASKATYNWALTALRMGRPGEAREALNTLDPDRGAMRGEPRYWMRQIEASHHLGDHEEELRQIDELATRFPDERSIFFYRVRALSALGWTESLKAAFANETVTRIPPEIVAVRYRNAAVDLFVHGHVEEARELARLGIAWIETRATSEDRMSSFSVGMDLRARQQMAYQKGRLLEVIGERQAALEIYQELYGQLPDAWFLRAHMGVVHAQLGHISLAMQIDRWLMTVDAPYRADDITTWRAGIAGALGDQEQATALLEQARQEGMYWSRLHPIYHLHAALGEFEPFISLMGPQG